MGLFVKRREKGKVSLVLRESSCRRPPKAKSRIPAAGRSGSQGLWLGCVPTLGLAVVGSSPRESVLAVVYFRRRLAGKSEP